MHIPYLVRRWWNCLGERWTPGVTTQHLSLAAYIMLGLQCIDRATGGNDVQGDYG